MQIRSILCVPLKHLDAQLGILNMSLTSERLFTIDDLKAINSLAPYAAMAIHNARNYSTLRHATDNLVAHATLLNM
jgi:GAF domain-containing protein